MSISKREMSSSPGFFDRISGAFSDRADRKKEEQMTEQLIKMSEYEGTLSTSFFMYLFQIKKHFIPTGCSFRMCLYVCIYIYIYFHV